MDQIFLLGWKNELVAWDLICKTEWYGGLGVKNLRFHGLALRTRWEWLRRTNINMPWHGLPILKDESTTSIFNSLSSIKVGKGEIVLIWTDMWVEGSTVEQMAPMIFSLVSTRRRNSRTVEEAMQENLTW